MVPNLGQNGQQAARAIDVYMLIEQFFNKFFNSLLLNLFVSVFPKERALGDVDRLYEANLKALEDGLKQIQMSDLTLYIEIKKAIQTTFDHVRGQIENSYNQQKPQQSDDEQPKE
jgi:hypothetical protein